LNPGGARGFLFCIPARVWFWPPNCN